jgi:hypothetical protein
MGDEKSEKSIDPHVSAYLKRANGVALNSHAATIYPLTSCIGGQLAADTGFVSFRRQSNRRSSSLSR